jgi:hypothetical protein
LEPGTGHPAKAFLINFGLLDHSLCSENCFIFKKIAVQVDQPAHLCQFAALVLSKQISRNIASGKTWGCRIPAGSTSRAIEKYRNPD